MYLLWFCRSNAFSGFSWLALDLRADWSKNEARVGVSVHQLLSLVEGCPGEHQFPGFPGWPSRSRAGFCGQRKPSGTELRYWWWQSEQTVKEMASKEDPLGIRQQPHC